MRKKAVLERLGGLKDLGVEEVVVAAKSPLHYCFPMKSAQNVLTQGVAAPELKLPLLGEMGVRTVGTLLQNLHFHLRYHHLNSFC